MSPSANPTSSKPFGTWPSPIDTELITSGAVGVGEVVVDGDDVWWGESRPDEGGRTAIVRRSPDGSVTEITPPDFNCRTRVHEYGGGSWWVDHGVLYCVDFADQRLQRIDPDGTSRYLSAKATVPAGLRFADGRVTPDGRWYVCVVEGHTGDGEPTNEIGAVATDGSLEIRTLAKGADFYAGPRISADGTALAWIQWDHPLMPWDETELWVAELADGSVAGARLVLGNGAESLVQPEWSPHGVLHVITDRDEWWNVVRAPAPGAPTVEFEPTYVTSHEAEVGVPHWVFGQSRYGFGPNGGVVHAVGSATGDQLLVATDSGVVDTDLAPDASTISSLRVAGGRAVFVRGSHRCEPEVCSVDLSSGATTVLRPARDLGIDPGFLPPPEQTSFTTGPDPAAPGAPRAFALVYRPAHPSVAGSSNTRPPLVVLIHGGPTAAARNQLQLGVRFWTSRGFAVADVDYRGSTGYGRTYRRQLHGTWGVADVEDAVAVAGHLAAEGVVDPDRLAIRGGSAGGFTVLAALAFHDVFTAGASHYGVADLSALAEDTHKFESRYLDSMVGPWPEARAVYEARSPINHTDGLSAPLILFQGLEDEIVPPSQAEAMVAALDAKGVPHAYMPFEGEQHGFRRAENIRAALEGELYFYGRVFGFDPADELAPVPITHLGQG
ncbi:MAG: S9 family peptidase [Actinomycetia bacterium]|nr:S9 family peptidase [Actinomycetes bacterium]